MRRRAVRQPVCLTNLSAKSTLIVASQASIRTTRQLHGGRTGTPRRRTTRDPAAYHNVRHWRQRLSQGTFRTNGNITSLFSDLLTTVFPMRLNASTSCTYALHEVCNRHLSCRTLWQLYQDSCKVDANNECVMEDE